MMRATLIIGWSFLVVMVFNYTIYEKEQTKKNGRIVFLELLPNDPRSLLQGDYMALRYAVESLRNYRGSHLSGRILVEVDSNHVGHFRGYYRGEALSQNEVVFKIRRKAYYLTPIPNSFFFQEGEGKYYEEAKYGIFKFDDRGEYILIGLANKDRKQIIPN